LLLNLLFHRFNKTICFAAKAGDIEIVKMLVNEGADVNYYSINAPSPPIYVACKEGHFEVVKYLIQKGAYINPPSGTSTEKRFYSPFIAAAHGGHIEILRYLIEKGADIHYRNSYGYNAIWHAVSGGGAVTNELPRISSRTHYGSSMTTTETLYNIANPEFIQAVERYQKTILFLKKIGVTLEQKNNFSDNPTPLHLFNNFAFAWRKYNPDFRNELRE